MQNFRFGLGAAAVPLASLLALTSPARAQLATREQAIVNGTRDPQLVRLDAAQGRAIGYLAGPRTPTESFCTGTLISDSVVLTAEHCVTYRAAGQVVFGVGDPSEPDGVFEASEVHRHPDLDVALIRLAEPVPDVAPLSWQRGTLDAAAGDDVEAAGYGNIGNGTQDGRFFVVLPMIEITASTIVVDGGGDRGICDGDSGGPIMRMLGDAPTVLAVESFGDENCVGQDTLIRTAAVEDWIEAGLAGELVEIEPADGCEGLDFLGRCSGDVAEWCDPDGIPASRDCSQDGETCGLVDEELGYYCIPRGDSDGACTFGESSCVGIGTRRYCLRERIIDEDCAGKGLRCAELTTGAWCVDEGGDPVAPPPVGDGCCRVGGGSETGGWWLLALLFGWRARRRAPLSARADPRPTRRSGARRRRRPAARSRGCPSGWSR